MERVFCILWKLNTPGAFERTQGREGKGREAPSHHGLLRLP